MAHKSAEQFIQLLQLDWRISSSLLRRFSPPQVRFWLHLYFLRYLKNALKEIYLVPLCTIKNLVGLVYRLGSGPG
jgi:hypothetical protein